MGGSIGGVTAPSRYSLVSTHTLWPEALGMHCVVLTSCAIAGAANNPSSPIRYFITELLDHLKNNMPSTMNTTTMNMNQIVFSHPDKRMSGNNGR